MPNNPAPPALPSALTIESLTAVHGTKAEIVYQQIAVSAGFGKFGKDYSGGYPPLDTTGLKGAQLTAVTAMFQTPQGG